MSGGRWPLHPQPGEREELEDYIRRLAGAYGVGYDLFLRRALGRGGRGARDIEGAGFDEVAARVSAGTGVPVDRLREMRRERVMARLAEAAPARGDTPEGRAARDALREAMRRMLRRLGTRPARHAAGPVSAARCRGTPDLRDTEPASASTRVETVANMCR